MTPLGWLGRKTSTQTKTYPHYAIISFFAFQFISSFGEACEKNNKNTETIFLYGKSKYVYTQEVPVTENGPRAPDKGQNGTKRH